MIYFASACSFQYDSDTGKLALTWNDTPGVNMYKAYVTENDLDPYLWENQAAALQHLDATPIRMVSIFAEIATVNTLSASS